jgi:hypothetical protein
MTGDEFGRALLAEIEKHGGMDILASDLRRVLGLSDPKAALPMPPSQTRVPPEFPHLHVQYDRASGNELDRKICGSLDEHGQILKSDFQKQADGHTYWHVAPIDMPLPPERTPP